MFYISVGTVTRLQDRWSNNRPSICGKSERLFCGWTVFDAFQAFYPVVTVSSFPECKAMET